ncbi:hypothetical protein BH23ACT2_BH23ACT2_20660 [soil metagenome]
MADPVRVTARAERLSGDPVRMPIQAARRRALRITLCRPPSAAGSHRLQTMVHPLNRVQMRPDHHPRSAPTLTRRLHGSPSRHPPTSTGCISRARSVRSGRGAVTTPALRPGPCTRLFSVHSHRAPSRGPFAASVGELVPPPSSRRLPAGPPPAPPNVHPSPRSRVWRSLLRRTSGPLGVEVGPTVSPIGVWHCLAPVTRNALSGNRRVGRCRVIEARSPLGSSSVPRPSPPGGGRADSPVPSGQLTRPPRHPAPPLTPSHRRPGTATWPLTHVDAPSPGESPVRRHGRGVRHSPGPTQRRGRQAREATGRRPHGAPPPDLHRARCERTVAGLRKPPDRREVRPTTSTPTGPDFATPPLLPRPPDARSPFAPTSRSAGPDPIPVHPSRRPSATSPDPTTLHPAPPTPAAVTARPPKRPHT